MICSIPVLPARVLEYPFCRRQCWKLSTYLQSSQQSQSRNTPTMTGEAAPTLHKTLSETSFSHGSGVTGMEFAHAG